MYSVCDYPYDKSCLCTFLHCHPYFILQFYSIVFYTCCPYFFRKEIACCPMLVCTACIEYWLATARCHNYYNIIFINFMYACIIIVQLCMRIVCSCCTGHYSDIKYFFACKDGLHIISISIHGCKSLNDEVIIHCSLTY